MKTKTIRENYLNRANSFIKEEENVTPEVIQLVVENMTKIRDAVGVLSTIYEDYPELNDGQPVNMEKVIPLSLNEWYIELINVIDEWKKMI